MKSGLEAMPLFLLDDLLSESEKSHPSVMENRILAKSDQYFLRKIIFTKIKLIFNMNFI